MSTVALTHQERAEAMSRRPSRTVMRSLDILEAALREREFVGVKKYGRTLDDQPDTGYGATSWPHMQLEELLDALNYAARDNLRLLHDNVRLTVALEQMTAQSEEHGAQLLRTGAELIAANHRLFDREQRGWS